MWLVKAATALSFLPSLLITLHTVYGATHAFVPAYPISPLRLRRQQQHHHGGTRHEGEKCNVNNKLSRTCICPMSMMATKPEQEDCGCAIPTEFAGKPPKKALEMTNQRTAISSLPLFKVDEPGISTNLNEIFGDPYDQGSAISMVVFLRSLG